jgi:hypothetical protein
MCRAITAAFSVSSCTRNFNTAIVPSLRGRLAVAIQGRAPNAGRAALDRHAAKGRLAMTIHAREILCADWYDMGDF